MTMKQRRQQQKQRKSALDSSLSSVPDELWGCGSKSDSFSTVSDQDYDIPTRPSSHRKIPISLSLHDDPSGLSSSVLAASRRGDTDPQLRRRALRGSRSSSTTAVGAGSSRSRVSSSRSRSWRNSKRGSDTTADASNIIMSRTARRRSTAVVSRKSEMLPRGTIPKKPKSERRFASTLLGDGSTGPPALQPRNQEDDSRREVIPAIVDVASATASRRIQRGAGSRDLCSSSRRSSKSLRDDVKVFDESSCSRQNNICNNNRKITKKKRDRDVNKNNDAVVKKVVPDRLMNALGRSIRRTPSGEIRELALSILLDDDGSNDNSYSEEDGSNESAILGARGVEDTISHLLANPAMIPFNIRW